MVCDFAGFQIDAGCAHNGRESLSFLTVFIPFQPSKVQSP
jgi:hypothetical protein